MTRLLDLLEEYFEWKGHKRLRLDGSTPSAERAELLRLFSAPDSQYHLFLLSTRYDRPSYFCV
jgi:SNF2 family DNA or RNA helicase